MAGSRSRTLHVCGAVFNVVFQIVERALAAMEVHRSIRS
jgi:hypothetical protein